MAEHAKREDERKERHILQVFHWGYADSRYGAAVAAPAAAPPLLLRFGKA